MRLPSVCLSSLSVHRHRHHRVVCCNKPKHKNIQRKEFLIAHRQITTKKEQAARNIYGFFFLISRSVFLSFISISLRVSLREREAQKKSLGQITFIYKKFFFVVSSSSYNFFFFSCLCCGHWRGLNIHIQ